MKDISTQVAICRVAGDITDPCMEGSNANNCTKWLETVSKAHNCKEEFIFIGAIPATAVIMGPQTHVKVHDNMFLEAMSLYVIFIANPSSAKSEAFCWGNLLLAWCRRRRRR